MRNAVAKLVIFATVLVIGGWGKAQSEDGIHRVNGELRTRTNVCSLGAGDGDRPVWSDPRLNSESGRQQIIDEASTRALKYLAQCHPDSILGQVVGMNYMTTAGRSLKALRGIKRMRSFEIHLGAPDITYVRIQRRGDSAARTTASGDYTHTPEQRIVCVPGVVGGCDTFGEDDDEHQIVDEFWRDNFRASIEVFPAVFERREYMIPGEDWAKDPVEAMVHVLLHELAHYEAYVSYESHYDRFPKVDAYEDDEKSETTANQWASSVWRCGQLR